EVEIDAIGPVKRQASGPHEGRVLIDRRYPASRDQSDNLITQRSGGKVARKKNAGILPLRQARDRAFDVGQSVDGRCDGLDGDWTGSVLDGALVDHCIRVVWIVDEGNVRDRGRNLLQQCKRLAEDRDLETRKAGDVAARPRQACRPTDTKRI